MFTCNKLLNYIQQTPNYITLPCDWFYGYETPLMDLHGANSPELEFQNGVIPIIVLEKEKTEKYSPRRVS